MLEVRRPLSRIRAGAQPRGALMLAVALATLILGGCGGGGSTSANTHPPPASPGKPRAVWGRPPDGLSPRGLVILIHGGGWRGIDPEAFRQTLAVATLVQRLGYATLTVDYRQGAAGIADVNSFYREARRRVGPHLPICAYGSSAGGHIGLMLAVENPDLNCVIDLAGPTDLPALRRDGHGSAAYDIALHAFGADTLARLSPALHAASINAKLLLVYAKDDPLVPVAQAREMARADPRAQLIVLPPGRAGFVHTGVGAPVADTGVSLTALRDAQRAEIDFLTSVARR